MWTTEKRRAERSRHDSVLEILDDDGRLTRGSARLVDFSSVGARIASTMVLAKGMRVRGRLRLLRTGALELTGRITRVERKTNFNCYGIEFEAVARTDVPLRNR